MNNPTGHIQEVVGCSTEIAIAAHENHPNDIDMAILHAVETKRGIDDHIESHTVRLIGDKAVAVENLDNAILLKITSFLQPLEMLQTALTCRRFGMANDNGHSLIEESARQLIMAISPPLATPQTDELQRLRQMINPSSTGLSMLCVYNQIVSHGICKVTECFDVCQPSNGYFQNNGYCQRHWEDSYCPICFEEKEEQFVFPCCRRSICITCWGHLDGRQRLCMFCRSIMERNT